MRSDRELIKEFERVLRDEALRRLGGGAKVDLADLDVWSVLTVYLNWLDRFPPPAPRRVHLSKAIQDQTRYRAEVDNLVAKIHSGANLKPHLSKSVAVAYSRQDERSQGRPDLDGLLADWGIHHLHLPSETDGTWSRRSGDLLFAYFTMEDAYLIDIFGHSWTKLSLLETMAREWPEAKLLMGSISGVRLNRAFNEHERQQLRDGGVATMVEIDGVVYSPRTQTVGGIASDIAAGVNRLAWDLQEIGKETRAWLRRQASGRGGDFWRAVTRGNSVGFTNGREFVSLFEFEVDDPLDAEAA